MSSGTAFDRLDPVPLAIATERFGFAFIAATGGIALSVIRDPRISPEVMVAGLCRAHAAGIASALSGAGNLVGGDPDQLQDLQDQLIDACTAMIRQEIARADYRATRQ